MEKYMWKLLFEFSDRLFALIPVKKWREYLRTVVLFDYRRKLNALQKKYPKFNWKKMGLTKGGGSIVFILDKKYTFKVRKRNNETSEFGRFEREKRVTDAIRPFCTIDIPEIEFVKAGGYTFYKTKYISGRPLVSVSSHRIRKYQDQISEQLAEFIYKKSLADPKELYDMRPNGEYKGWCWNHSDMCSNILIDPKTMVITGIIDWEWAGFGPVENEFNGLVWVRKKMRKIGLDKSVKEKYQKICKKS